MVKKQREKWSIFRGRDEKSSSNIRSMESDHQYLSTYVQIFYS